MAAKTRVLVTGARGMLGRDVVDVFRSYRHEVVDLGRQNLDVTDLEGVMRALQVERPNVVVNCAAYTDVDRAESEPHIAYLVNALGARHLALASRAIGADLVQISTDYVFDGRKQSPYYIWDATAPLNVYGKSKALGEEYVRSLNSRHYIVRTSWLFGRRGPNFVDAILALSMKQSVLRVVTDQRGCPTFTRDLARALIRLIQTGAYGTYHITNQGGVTRYEFARGVLHLASQRCSLEPISTDDLPRPARRPVNSELAPFPLRETIGGLHLGRGAPAWLKDWAVSVQLKPEGAWHDSRGAWVPRTVEPVLGEGAREAALTAARLRAAGAARTLEDARAGVERAAAMHENASRELNEERRRREIAERVARLPHLRAAQQEAARRLGAARTVNEEKAAAAVAASLAFQKARGDVEDIERSLGDLAKRMEGEQAALLEAEQETQRCDEAIRGLSAGVTPELRARAERMELDSAETVEGDLRRARRALEDLGDRPDETIREEERHLTANVEEAELHVSARAREAAAAREELSACRQRYLEVVSGALHDYRRRAVEIARAAQVAVEMELPELRDDDRALDEAQLFVRFGFDSKEPLPLGDSSFSGGQQVVAGLVLLMAMVEGGGRGFFMLDEPFAHLSIDRIDDVGRFLRASGAQFIITAPTTLDRAQLDPASLVVMLRKKRADQPHAPVPVIAEA